MSTDHRVEIENSIRKLIIDFKKYPNKYLTEDDVRFHLCHHLMEKYGKLQKTKDNEYSIALHTEVRWYGPDELKLRSDIVIFDVSELDVDKETVWNKYRRKLIPSKGYASNKVIGIIEIKFRRFCKMSDAEFTKSIQKDINKLKKIKAMFEGNYFNAPIVKMVTLDKRHVLTRFSGKEQINGIDFVYSFSDHTSEKPDLKSMTLFTKVSRYPIYMLPKKS